MRTRFYVALLVCVLDTGAAADEQAWISQQGLFVVRYQSEINPLTINTLHSWRVHVEDATGEAVLGASIAVTGGMPVHDHGLPTEPRVTTELGGGDYRLDGLRFHMAGPWEITFSITAGSSTDTVVIALTL